MTSVFLSVLKTAKVVPVFKKDSKLDYNNYCPISLLSNIEKYLKNLCIKDCIPSSITTDVPWEDIFKFSASAAASGFRLELMYISLIVSIRSNLTHLHCFQQLVLLP